MNYHKYFDLDVVNGPGTRCTLFVSGCIHQCRGCYNQATWSPTSGHPYTQELQDKIIEDLNDTRIVKRGLSLSGGDPLLPSNVSEVLKLVKRVKQECSGKDIWLWTGYLHEEMSAQQLEVLKYVDVLIDGKFEKELYSVNLEWRGSSNQRVIMLTESKLDD